MKQDNTPFTLADILKSSTTPVIIALYNNDPNPLQVADGNSTINSFVGPFEDLGAAMKYSSDVLNVPVNRIEHLPVEESILGDIKDYEWCLVQAEVDVFNGANARPKLVPKRLVKQGYTLEEEKSNGSLGLVRLVKPYTNLDGQQFIVRCRQVTYCDDFYIDVGPFKHQMQALACIENQLDHISGVKSIVPVNTPDKDMPVWSPEYKLDLENPVCVLSYDPSTFLPKYELLSSIEMAGEYIKINSDYFKGKTVSIIGLQSPIKDESMVKKGNLK